MAGTLLVTILMVLLWMAGAPGWAQSQEASVSGIIRSQSGMPIASAEVIAKELATGQDHIVRSDDAGLFNLSPLPPGTYRLGAGKPGFVPATQETVELQVGAQLAMNFVLETEQGSAAGATPGESSSASRNAAAAPQSSGQISESQLVGLPLNGRSYSQLATLQAGVTDTSAASSSRGVSGGNLSVVGGRSVSNNFLLDGTNIMDTENLAPRSAAGVQLGSDAILQVQVFSANYGAEYGRGSGGVLNSISRSGSNSFQGTFFEYFRNSKMDARNFFDGAEAPSFKRNQFGATISGPVTRDKIYFLASFEAMRDRQNWTDVSFFPDAAVRQGPGIDPRVKLYLGLYPIPNDSSIGGGIARHLAPQFLPTDETFFTVRVDQKLTERAALFGRYTFDDATSRSAQDTYLFNTVNKSRQQYLTLVGSHIFSPRTIASYRFAYTRPVSTGQTLQKLAVDPSLYFIPGAAQFGQIQVPGLSTLGADPTIPRGNKLNTFQYAFDLLAQRGAHSLKTGIEIHRYRVDVFSDWFKAGAWSFNSLASFLQAGPVGTGVTIALPGSDNAHAFRQVLLGTYLQDQYRVTPRFSLSMGLRYEFASDFTDNLNRMVYLPDPVHDTQVQTGRYLQHNPSAVSFAPRLGFNWTPRSGGSTAVSGGFGIYYDQIIGYVANNRKSTAPFHNILVNPNASLASVYFPKIVPAAGNVPPAVQVMDYSGMVNPMVLRYNFSLQQSLAAGWRAQAAYVGARGNHLFRRYEVNQFPLPEIRPDGSLFFPPQCAAPGEPVIPQCRAYAGPINPAFGALSMLATDAQSFYNSLQLSASKNLSRGFSLQASYSFSKSVDDGSIGGNQNFGQYALMRTLDRGLSDFDIRHRVVLNYLYALPEFAGGSSGRISRFLSQVFGGWRLGGIVSFRSGTPFSPAVNIRYAGYLFGPTRPNLLPGQSNNPTSGDSSCGSSGQKLGTPELYFDPCAFEVPPRGTLGNAGRNTVLSASIFSADVSIQKDFLLDAKRRLQFRGEIFNFPNHTNFNPVSAGSAVVNTSRAGRLSPPTNTTSRQVQFALRLSF
ncbi:MAG: TonB-dependent receptor [Acidobacteria bacterium]|nr:TonB-dependent receptor [Acidobacteriota bacterium]